MRLLLPPTEKRKQRSSFHPCPPQWAGLADNPEGRELENCFFFLFSATTPKESGKQIWDWGEKLRTPVWSGNSLSWSQQQTQWTRAATIYQHDAGWVLWEVPDPGAEHEGKIQLYRVRSSQQGWPGQVQTGCWHPVPPYCPSWKVSTAREALSSLYSMCHFKTKYISLRAFGHLYEGQDLHTNCLWISQILSCLLISGKADVKPKGWTIQVLSEHSV